MSREPSPRRRPDPAALSRTPSQEQLIAELQGRLGIQPEAEEAAGPAGASAQDWLTEGVVITVQPRGRRAGGQLVEKVAQGLGTGVQMRHRPQWGQRGDVGEEGRILASCDMVGLASLLMPEWEGPGTWGCRFPLCSLSR